MDTRFALLSEHEQFDTERTIKEFGGGTCYVYDSLPFTYMFFVKNQGMDALYDCASAGGN